MSRPKDVPVKRIIITDPRDIPKDVGRTPGGTLYSTTPGGSRIIYDRQQLIDMRSSPLSKSPPANMAIIPGITSASLIEDQSKTSPRLDKDNKYEKRDKNSSPDRKFDEQFPLDEDY